MLPLHRPIPTTFLLLSLLAIGFGACSTPTEPSQGKEALPSASPAPARVTTISAPPPRDPPPDLGPARNESLLSVSAALETASREAIGAQQLPKEPFSYHEILDESRPIQGSLSLGTIREGQLRQAMILDPVGEFHEILASHRPRRTNFATAELVNALQTAAEEVAREFGGAPLRIGNLSYRHGGRIPWSNSHQAGRDADLTFYAIDADGHSLPTPALISFDDDGNNASLDLRFDAPRNWAVVRSLLNNETINVQWLFISEGLKDLLLAQAISLEEDSKLIERAAQILHQPTDAPAHDDHLHVRIGCSRADRLEGCVDWGPRWPWYDWHDAQLLARTLELQRAFDDESASTRLDALSFLHRIRSPWAAEVAIDKGIIDDDPAVRARAFELLLEIAPRTIAGVLAIENRLMDPALPRENSLILYDALRRTSTPATAAVALRRYQDLSRSEEERLAAIQALDHQMRPDLVPDLLDALSEESSPLLRGAIARLLSRITLRSDDLDWSADPLTQAHLLALQDWQRWWTQQSNSREQLQRDFLMQRGIHAWKDLHFVDEIIPLLRSSSDFERYNANLILSAWTGRWAPKDWEAPADAHRFWTRWWERNRERMLHQRPRAWQ